MWENHEIKKGPNGVIRPRGWVLLSFLFEVNLLPSLGAINGTDTVDISGSNCDGPTFRERRFTGLGNLRTRPQLNNQRYDIGMPDYYGRFLFGTACTIMFGLFFEFMFRRSKNESTRSQGVFAGLFTVCWLIWTIYSFVRWRLAP